MTTTRKKWTYYIISRTISRLIPLVFIIHIYGLIERHEARTSLTGISMIVFAILFILFWKDLSEMAQGFGEKYWAYVSGESKLFVFFLILLLFIQWAKSGIGNLELLVLVLTITQGVAIFPSAKYKQLLHLEKQEKLAK